jgi:NitT/TauT family transport system permease protein
VALNKLPIATVTVREGARSLDHALDDMAQVFRMGAWTRMRHVILPQLAPYLAAAARSGLSLVWKIVLIVELLGRPNGVGFEIGVAFQLFDVTRILAYALAFIAVMLAIETFLVQPFERHVARCAGQSMLSPFLSPTAAKPPKLVVTRFGTVGLRTRGGTCCGLRA